MRVLSTWGLKLFAVLFLAWPATAGDAKKGKDKEKKEAPETPLADPEKRQAAAKLLKDLRAALVTAGAGKEAGEDLKALTDAVKEADDGTLAALLLAAERLAAEQATEAAGKALALAWGNQSAEALAKLDSLMKAFAAFPEAGKALEAAKNEVQNDQPSPFLGEYWRGAALGAVRYAGPGGTNPMAWFKPPPKKIASDTGLPYLELQPEDILGNADDTNGILLYPDGTTRVRFMLWPGGDPSTCMNSLRKAEGMGHVKAAFDTGMNYMGICSGCYLVMERAFKLWPGEMSRKEPTVKDPPHDIVFPPFHPLARALKTDTLPQVAFTGGINQMTADVPNTEYIGFFRHGGDPGMEGRCAVMAYSPPGYGGGRLVVCPAHPEAKKPEFLVMMAEYSMRHRYALPRNRIEIGTPVKGVCGDHQNQYYEFRVGEGVKKLEVTLTELTGDCALAVKYAEPPKPLNDAIKPGSKPGKPAKKQDKKIPLPSPKPGVYFIQIHGNHDILNGVNYTLTVITDSGS